MPIISAGFHRSHPACGSTQGTQLLMVSSKVNRHAITRANDAVFKPGASHPSELVALFQGNSTNPFARMLLNASSVFLM